jgi:hypothetical protein
MHFVQGTAPWVLLLWVRQAGTVRSLSQLRKLWGGVANSAPPHPPGSTGPYTQSTNNVPHVVTI